MDSEPRATPERRWAFEGYELLAGTGELFRGGERVPLQHQPAQLLALLVARAGEAVSREEIRDEIWGRETFVDHDQSINYCIRQIRQALEDDPSDPRFVETVPRHGYRFVARVEEVRAAVPAPAVAAPRARRWHRSRVGVAAGVAAAVGLALAALVGLRLATGAAGPGEAENPPASADAQAGEAAPSSQLVVPEEAHFRFLEARYLMERATPEEHVAASTEAIELLEAVIAEVPRFAEAHAVLADAWLYRYDVPRPEVMERSEAAARRALELDPSQPLAHAVLAATRLFHHLDWRGAEEHVDRGLELAPDSAETVFLSAILHSTLGRHEQAIAAARRAAALDPGELQGISLAWFHFFARRWDRAVVEAERVLAIAPADEPSHQVLVLTHLVRGDDAAADSEIDRFYARIAGLPEGADPEMPGARELYRSWFENRDAEVPGSVSPMFRATYSTFAGEPGAAVGYLLEACRERAATWDLPFVAVDPRWDPLRGREDFEEVLRCVGVPGTAGVPLEGLEG